MKTLANCTCDEFLSQAYQTRRAFHDLYHAVNVDALRGKYAAEREKADSREERADIDKRFRDELWTRLMRDHVNELMAVIAACAFLTPDETKQLSAAEAMEIVSECITDKSVMSFFISAEQLAGDASEGILPMLLLIASAATEKTTSQTVSQSSTNETSSENSASAISQSVSAAS